MLLQFTEEKNDIYTSSMPVSISKLLQDAPICKIQSS